MTEPYAVEVPLRWSDMDAYGHVNNVQYLRLLEDARVVGLREWLPTGATMLEEGIVVSRHAIEYRAPLTYRPAPVRVDLWVTHVHGCGFDLGYVVRDPASVGESVYAVAETGLVLYDFDAGRPRRLAPTAREVLGAHVGDPVAFRWDRR
ncbi:acyl-CoA thioesterase [Phycicoccus endophyticus]|uniref:Acyl-CoA thioesterase n=1 Tax=Phycicoccus endophyticus TaxID=1690220 RepID=A0A7G9R3E1_9MICO|nr:thioesterase family protein [Phycicoccus endophyticus]NHI19871.1 acyl-CoA thioesterase [Phycicoccus endophyticus]QNN50116.1 acyl-CoA thioesterase [Phycicoccus endophyticus]GGL27880.1 thioesterase [Phycicoccus endophyticus]